MLVSISEAAKLAGVSRTTLYKKHIQTGTLTVTKNHQNRPEIDTSEIFRVFGSLNGTTKIEQPETQGLTLPLIDKNSVKIEQLQAELKHLQELLTEKDERIADLKKALNLIEYTQQTQSLTALKPHIQETKEPATPTPKQIPKTTKVSLLKRFKKWLNS